MAMRRDPVIMQALRARQYPTTQLPWHLEGDNEEDQEEQFAIKTLTEIINETPRFQEVKKQLMEALFYGRYGAQFTFNWDWSKGYKRMLPLDHRPVDGDKMIFKFYGDPGILVHQYFDPPHPNQLEISDRGRCYFLNPLEREQFIIHRFEPEDTDFYQGELAGQVMGVGLRSRLYWFWWLRNEVQGWMLDYLERVGAGGILVYFYEAGNPESQEAAFSAAANTDRDTALVLPRPIGGEKAGPGIQQLEPAEAGSNLLIKLITEYFDSVMRLYILGQKLTSDTAPTGLGSEVAKAHENTFNLIIQDDAKNLADTLTMDFIRVLQKYNFPKLKSKLRWVFECNKPNPKEILESAKIFYDLGGEISADQLRGIIGLKKPKKGEEILKKPEYDPLEDKVNSVFGIGGKGKKNEGKEKKNG